MESIMGDIWQMGIGAAFGMAAMYGMFKMYERNHEYQKGLAERLAAYDKQMIQIVKSNTIAMSEVVSVVREFLNTVKPATSFKPTFGTRSATPDSSDSSDACEHKME